MKTIDGRQWARREDLIERSGYSRATLENLWRNREVNDHPPARKIGRVMYWDLEEWTRWFERHLQRQRHEWMQRDNEQQRKSTHKVDRSGDPYEELPPAEQARVLGVDPRQITRYAKHPPPGWPPPVRVEELPTRRREYRTRQQLWQFADSSPRFGYTGPGPARKARTTDLRLRRAIKALEDLRPGREPVDLAAKLAAHHGGSISTWGNVITQARKARPDLFAGAAPAGARATEAGLPRAVDGEQEPVYWFCNSCGEEVEAEHQECREDGENEPSYDD
jgi:hypothetical protein